MAPVAVFRWRPRSAALGTDEPVSDGMVSVRPNGFIDPCIASAQRSGTSPDSNASLSTVEPVSIRTANSSWEKVSRGQRLGRDFRPRRPILSDRDRELTPLLRQKPPEVKENSSGGRNANLRTCNQALMDA